MNVNMISAALKLPQSTVATKHRDLDQINAAAWRPARETISTPSNGSEQIFCCPLRALASSVWIRRLLPGTLMLVATVDAAA